MDNSKFYIFQRPQNSHFFSVRGVLAVLCLLGIYTYVRIYITPTLVVPAVVAGATGIPLLFLNYKKIKKKHLIYLGLYLGLVFIGILFAPEPVKYFIDRFKGYLYLIYSIFIGYSLFLEFLRWPRKRLSNLFFLFMVIILVGCFLENYLGFNAISDWFRNAVFEKGLYEADLRDIAVYGIIRPKLFTSEPSHVAKFFTLCLTVWLILTKTKFKYLKFFVLVTLGLFLIRSPIILLAIINVFFIFYIQGDRKPQRAIEERIFLYLFIAIAIISILFFSLTTLMSGRLQDIENGSDDSFILRLVAPAYIAQETLKLSPFWGSGVSGNETIIGTMQEIFYRLNVDTDRIAETLESKIFNVFWLHWTYLGLVGGVLSLFIFRCFMKFIGVKHLLLSSIILFGFSQTMGGYNGARFWCIVFLIFTALAKSNVEQMWALKPIMKKRSTDESLAQCQKQYP